MHHFTTPKIYVADLAAYNAGRLIGEWLYLPDYHDVDDLMRDVKDVLEEGEEWAVHDYEGLPRSLYSEYPGRDGLRQMLYYVDLLDECRRPDAADYFVQYIALDRDYDPEEWPDYFQQSYRGTYESPEDWAYEYIESTGMLGDMPENLQYYFDYEKFARDVRIGGDMDFHRDGAQVHVFDPHI